MIWGNLRAWHRMNTIDPIRLPILTQCDDESILLLHDQEPHDHERRTRCCDSVESPTLAVIVRVVASVYEPLIATTTSRANRDDG